MASPRPADLLRRSLRFFRGYLTAELVASGLRWEPALLDTLQKYLGGPSRPIAPLILQTSPGFPSR